MHKKSDVHYKAYHMLLNHSFCNDLDNWCTQLETVAGVHDQQFEQLVNRVKAIEATQQDLCLKMERFEELLELYENDLDGVRTNVSKTTIQP
jgi:two-component sensor histidine kinase